MNKITNAVNEIIKGGNVRNVILEASGSNDNDTPWNMSKPGDPDFIHRICDMYEDDQETHIYALKAGPKKDGMPEYVDVNLAHLDYESNHYSWYYTYRRFYPDGSDEDIEKSEFGK